MLIEAASSAEQSEAGRRWFADEYFELIVWVDEQSEIEAFRLCYDRFRVERVLSWTRRAGYRHERVDDGEQSPLKNRTPVLTADGAFDAAGILRRFEPETSRLPRPIASFVIEKLRQYPGGAS